MDTPVLRMLEGMRGRAWLHMPGHGGGSLAYLSAALDVTELEASDDLMDPAAGGAFDRAQRLAARAAGAGATLFLTGGASQGIHAMLTAFVPQGGKVILPRDAHKSAIAACAVGDLRPQYVWPRIREQKALLETRDVLLAMEAHPDAAALLLTRPDYYGVCQDLAPVVRKARQMGIALLVDEAHGAHLPYGGDIPSAGALGADAWVHSAHKTLPALTQGAYLHLRDPALADALRRRIALLGTTSPSFLVAASLDMARALMERNGKIWLEEAHERNHSFVRSVQPYGVLCAHDAWRDMGYACDPGRIVLDVRAFGRSGYDVLKLISARGVDVEMADCYRLVALPPLAGEGQREALAALAAALGDFARAKESFTLPQMPLPRAEEGATPRRASFGRSGRVALARARGRIAAAAVGIYPPGIPLVMPGEILSGQAIQALEGAKALGARLFGLGEGDTVSVMEE